MSGRAGSVVVGDADRSARASASTALRRAGFETIEVETGADALRAAADEAVAVVLLEVEFPDITGYEVCQELRRSARPGLGIFFVSGIRTEPLDRVAGLLLGADDFIVKPVDPNELIARVRRFISRRPTLRPLNGHEMSPSLTEREYEVLSLLAKGARPKEVAQQLSISPKTVGTHIQNLLGKVGVHSRAELVARAYMLGLVGRPAVAAGRDEPTHSAP